MDASPELKLHCDLDPAVEAGVRACPCPSCRLIVRGIKDDFDASDLQDTVSAQRNRP